MEKCILCHCPARRTVFHEEAADIMRCLECGHYYSTYRQDQDYQGYFPETTYGQAETEWWDRAHRDMYQAFADRFLKGRGGRLLDVGAGLGFFVKFAGEQPGWQAVGYEIAPGAVRYAQVELKLREFHLGRVEDNSFAPESFDMITLWDVIEHLPDPHGFLESLKRLLKPGGLIFFHTPNMLVQLPKARFKVLLKGYDLTGQYLEAKDHINIYTPRSLERLLKDRGFRDIRFHHLPPIQLVSGSGKRTAVLLKNAWAKSAALLDRLTAGRLNFDNLFASAKK